MAKFGLLTIPIFMLGIGLAACSGGGTPTAGSGGGTTDPGSGGEPEPTEPSEELQDAERAKAAAEAAVERLAAALQNAPEAQRATATLSLAAARADLTSLTAKVDLERARAAVEAADADARAASTDAARAAARTSLQTAEARLSAVVEVAARGLREAEAALAARRRGRSRRRGKDGGAGSHWPSDEDSGRGQGFPDFGQSADRGGEAACRLDGRFGFWTLLPYEKARTGRGGARNGSLRGECHDCRPSARR